MSSPGEAQPPSTPEIEQLVARHRGDALRVARRLVRTEAEAEDLTQTAVLNVLRRADHIEDPSRVKAYLLTSVRNLWRNQLRQQGRRRFVGSDAAELVAATDPGPEELVLNALDVRLARDAVGYLSRTSREILLLRYVEGIGFAELADRLGITPVAARQRAHRAREELIGVCIEQSASGGQGSCRSVRARLGRYLRGQLTRKVRAQIGAHLSACSRCAACYAQLEELYGDRLVSPEELS